MKAMHMTTRENATERKIWIYNEQQQYNFWQQERLISRNFSSVLLALCMDHAAVYKFILC